MFNNKVMNDIVEATKDSLEYDNTQDTYEVVLEAVDSNLFYNRDICEVALKYGLIATDLVSRLINETDFIQDLIEEVEN